MDTIFLKKINAQSNSISYEYKLEGEWKKYINEENFYIKYDKDIEIKNIPNSILSIPFLVNILPISWIFNLKIKIPELDEKFYYSINKIKEGYKIMYPNIDFRGSIEVDKIVNNSYRSEKSAVLFSGGVDAFNTVVRHIKEKPDLITIFGADIRLEDTQGIEQVNSKNKKISKDLNLNYRKIFSNFRTFINFDSLNIYVSSNFNLEWWHDFQHGIALLGLAVPITFIRKMKILYIASSFNEKDKGNYTSASDPVIDNNFYHSSCKVIHDGYELDRQDKIHNICEFVKNTNSNIDLHVCWITAGGENCCNCEKCFRTILGIMVENENPIKYGFKFTSKNYKLMKSFFKSTLKYNTQNGNLPNYYPIQRKAKELYQKKLLNKRLYWFIRIKIGQTNPNIIYKIKKRYYKYIRKMNIS